MKYIKTFEEIDNQFKIPFNFNDKNRVFFEDEKYIIVKPTSEEDIDYVFNTESRYSYNDNTYVNINKKTKERTLFDFHNSEFRDIDDNNINLKEFFEENKSLLNFYGELIDCNNIKKIDNEYWMLFNDYVEFDDYFKIQGNYRNDLVKTILSGSFIDYYSHGDDDYHSYVKLNDENLMLLKSILLMEKYYSDGEFDYVVQDIKDYNDVEEILDNNDMSSLEDALKDNVGLATMYAEEDDAWKDVTDEFYSFFNLDEKSLKWVGPKLMIKFKDNMSAYYAKFRVINFDDSYYDDFIEYSPPYYGYSASSEDYNKHFNDTLFDSISNQYDSKIYDDIIIIFNLYKELPNESDEKILDEFNFKKSVDKFNL